MAPPVQSNAATSEKRKQASLLVTTRHASLPELRRHQLCQASRLSHPGSPGFDSHHEHAQAGTHCIGHFSPTLQPAKPTALGTCVAHFPGPRNSPSSSSPARGPGCIPAEGVWQLCQNSTQPTASPSAPSSHATPRQWQPMAKGRRLPPTRASSQVMGLCRGLCKTTRLRPSTTTRPTCPTTLNSPIQPTLSR